MTTFKIGEIAVLQNIKGPLTYLNGTECEITELLARRTLIVREPGGLRFGFVFAYTVHIANDLLVWASPYMLRKKNPPSEFAGETSITELFQGKSVLEEMACAA